ncbi:MAG: PD-(D/E)XK nuclease family protein [Ilumatobacteraceae bacterium]
MGSGALTPLQQRMLDQLRKAAEPVVFDPALAEDIRATVSEAIEAFGERLDGEQLWVSKHRLSTVLGCEAHAMAPDEFSWSPATATGQVSHRAIQLLVNWRGEPTPADLVDEAIARLADDDRSLGQWIAALSPGDEADLRGNALERVTRFVEGFPPLDKRSHPMTEARVQWPLDGPVVLAGKVDLVMGRPNGGESTKLIIDLKTGRHSPRHRDDLRFYALVETLRTGVPPRKLASYYLDVGEADVEDVTEAVLRTATRRTLDAVDALVELTTGEREPAVRPGPTCNWCSLRPNCDPGQAYLAGDLDPDR